MQGSTFAAATRLSRFTSGRTSVRALPAITAAAFALVLPASALAATNTGLAPDCGCGHVIQYRYDGPTAAAATGSDSYLVFVPDSYTGRRRVPLVVVTHGSNTTAAEQEAANNYDRVAERDGFIVMYPDDNDDLHPGPSAWGQSVGAVWQADVALIAGMTRATMASYRIDPQRVYEIGMSAGAIVTSDLAATYPDLYAAVGIMAGAPYSGFAACETGQDPAAGGYDPQLLADSYGAYQAEGANARVMPVVVLNGDADGTVNPLCDRLAVEQWLTTDNLVLDGQTTGPLSLTPSSDTPGQVPGGYKYDVFNYTQPSGCVVVRHLIVHGMNHDWSGGTTNPAYSGYTDPKGPSASEASWAFFSHYTLRSTSRRCAEARAPRSGTGSGDSLTAVSADAAATTGVQQAAQSVNALAGHRNQVSIAYLPTSGACFSPVAATPGCLAYSSVALQAAGATPGSTVTIGGLNFQWPNTSSGQPDSLSPAGQTIPVTAPAGTNRLAILGAGEQGGTTGPSSTVVELRYTGADGGADTDIDEVSFPNWDGLLANGSTSAASNELRSDAAVLNSTVPVATPASVFAVTLPVDPGRRLISVTFADTDPSLRIFDMQAVTVGKDG